MFGVRALQREEYAIFALRPVRERDPGGVVWDGGHRLDERAASTRVALAEPSFPGCVSHLRTRDESDDTTRPRSGRPGKRLRRNGIRASCGFLKLMAKIDICATTGRATLERACRSTALGNARALFFVTACLCGYMYSCVDRGYVYPGRKGFNARRRGSGTRRERRVEKTNAPATSHPTRSPSS